jgi:hypothetical protein
MGYFDGDGSINKKEGYIIYCASNSIWNTIKTILLKKEILSFIDYFISNFKIENNGNF